MHNYEMIFKAAKRNDRNTFRELFFELHIKDRMELYHALYPKNKQKIEAFLTAQEFAELFEWMSPREQQQIMAVFSDDYIAELLLYMESDNVVKFLAHLTQEEMKMLVSKLDQANQAEILEMLSFELESAGSLMNKSYVSASVADTIKETMERVQALARSVEMIYYVYVLDAQERLCGVFSMRELLLHYEDSRLEDVMREHFVSVSVTDDQEEAALLLQEYDLMALPVLDDQGQMQGIITVDDMMDVMTEEVLEDFKAFAAISKPKKTESGADTAWAAARVRMPWIVLLIFLGMLSASLISSFEDTLNEVVLLAAFIPIIMDSAGNVGTQSLAVAVRKITMGDRLGAGEFWSTVWQELLVGMLLGIAAGVTLGLIVAIFYGNTVLALIIAFSLFVTLSFSNVVGAVIPALIHKLNIDPAVASGPFITTINDAAGLMIYFSVATQFLHLL